MCGIESDRPVIEEECDGVVAVGVFQNPYVAWRSAYVNMRHVLHA